MTTSSHDDSSAESADELALRALQKCWPGIQPEATEYTDILDGLKAMREHLGARKFELYYNLRPPTDLAEEWMRDCYQGRITEEEFRDRLKRDAERPIDLRMLTTFHEAYEANAHHYSAILQAAVVRPSEDNSHLRAQRMHQIDVHMSQLGAKLPLWRENWETVFDFLDDVRLSSNLGLEKLGEFEATSAHWLAELLFMRIAEAWRSCVEIAHRSQHDCRYLYAVDAIDLFRDQWHATFPPPQNLSERLRREFKLARRALVSMAEPSTPTSTEASSGSDRPDLAGGAPDNESREMVLIGELTTIVGNAGHIFRRLDTSDWGIDGEIEFKDDAGLPTGRRVYVQLKSGDSYLTRRKSDGNEIFRVRKQRHLQYWLGHAYPVFLVIRQSTGLIRWMDIRQYALRHGSGNLQVVFRGDTVDSQAVKNLARAVTETQPRPDDTRSEPQL
jgi:hypothetical protein